MASAAPGGQPAPSPNYNTFTAEVTTAAGAPLLLQNWLRLTPTHYSATATGGPATAEITVTGEANDLAAIAEWLGYRVIIRNPAGRIVWLGYIHDATLRHGAIEIGYSLEQMANRIAADYTDDDATGTAQAGRTAWSDNIPSQTRYGIKEDLLSFADSSAAQAAALVATQLAARSQPLPTLEINDDAAASSGVLYCRGWWAQLEWQFYADDGGRQVSAAAADKEHALGYARTAADLGFKDAALHDLAARLAELPTHQQITVSGAGQSANNGVLQLTRTTDAPAKTLTAATISFDPADDILDSANGLNIFDVGEMLRVTGASQSANNAVRFIKTKESETGNRLEATPFAIVAESAGATVTLTQGHSVEVQRTGGASFVREPAGANVTLTPHGSKLAQSFQLASSAGWTVRQVAIQARRIGSPADLRISIHSDSAGAPGAQLITATLPAAAIPTSLGWVQASFGAGAALNLATTYWLVVEVDGGAVSDTASYRIGLDSTLADPAGSLLAYHAGAWAARTPDADLPYQLWGLLDTATQIEQMLTRSGVFDAVSVLAASGVETRQYRAGDQRIRTELERLLAVGDDDAVTLTATVLPAANGGRSVVIASEPAPDDAILLLPSGSLVEALRQRWEPGVLPVARWVAVAGVPTPYARTLRLYIADAEYDIAADRLRVTPRLQPAPWGDDARAGNMQALAQNLKPYTLAESSGAEFDRSQYYTAAAIDSLLANYLLKSQYSGGDLSSAGLLASLLTVDGSGSGLDADTVDGQHASAFAAAVHGHDHGALTGLSDDDHTQYALLAGRSGGQTLIGGTGSSDKLILNPTSSTTPTSGVAAVVIEQESGISQIDFYGYRESNGTRSRFRAFGARGTKSSPGQTLSNDLLFNISARGHTGSEFGNEAGGFFIYCAEDTTSTNQGTMLRLLATPTGTATQQIMLLVSNYRLLLPNSGVASTPPANLAAIFCADLSAGDAAIHLQSESGAIYKFGSYSVLPGSIRPAADSTTALQLATAGGTGIVIVDTTNKIVTVKDSLIVNEDGGSTGDLRAESDTEANMLWLDASDDVLYLGGSTVGVKVAKGGDTTFLGDGSGLPYGSCYGNEIDWAQASAAQNTWYEVSDADMADGELNLVTHDGSGKLTVSVAGRYLINYTCSAEVSLPGKHVQSGISVSGTESAAGISHYNAATANEQFNVSGTAILDLAANATVEMSLRTTDTGTPNLAVDHLNITIVMVGGT